MVVSAFDRVAALTEEAGAEELLEGLGRDELARIALRRSGGSGLASEASAMCFADPILLGGAGDVAVLRPDLAAIDAAHDRDDFAQRHGRRRARPPLQGCGRSQIVRP
jgi:hypothetical protein